MSQDKSTKQAIDNSQDMLILKQRVDRLERWIKQIAAKTGIKLEY